MSRSIPTDVLPPTARTIALLLASTPTIQDAQPGVLHQLLELSHRYTSQVLSDALVYAEHAGRPGKIEMDDIVLAIQARVGWEYGGRVPKEHTLTLATQVNAVPLPPVPEVFGIRAPSASLTNVDFDLVPNKPPPTVKIYDEEIEEVEEEEDDEDDYEQVPISNSLQDVSMRDTSMLSSRTPGIAPTPSDADMASPAPVQPMAEGSDIASDDEDGLFAGGDDDSEGDDAMENVLPAPTEPQANAMKRKLVEEDDYD